jgi:archaellum component FlaG (FlaF/FlaG flagellin family)
MTNFLNKDTGRIKPLGDFGWRNVARIENTYHDKTKLGVTLKDEYFTGKTTDYMKHKNTFVNWDFNNIWSINNGYPYLKNISGSEIPVVELMKLPELPTNVTTVVNGKKVKIIFTPGLNSHTTILADHRGGEIDRISEGNTFEITYSEYDETYLFYIKTIGSNEIESEWSNEYTVKTDVEKIVPIVEASNTDYSIKNSNIEVALNYIDKESGIKERQYQVTNSIDIPITWTNYKAPVILSAEGNHFIHYRAVDNAQNVKTGYFGPYTIDKTGPIVTASTLDSESNYTILRLDYIDNVSSIREKKCQITNSVVIPTSWNDYTRTLLLKNHGDNYIHYKGVDNAGNVTKGYFGPYKINKPNSYDAKAGDLEMSIDSITQTNLVIPGKEINLVAKIRNSGNLSNRQSILILKDSKGLDRDYVDIPPIQPGTMSNINLSTVIKPEDIVSGMLRYTFDIEFIDTKYITSDEHSILVECKA